MYWTGQHNRWEVAEQESAALHSTCTHHSQAKIHSYAHMVLYTVEIGASKCTKFILRTKLHPLKSNAIQSTAAKSSCCQISLFSLNYSVDSVQRACSNIVWLCEIMWTLCSVHTAEAFVIQMFILSLSYVDTKCLKCRLRYAMMSHRC